ncbi:MAG: IS4 family transposase [Bacteroidota bacterium]|nr:IS4 family transposase [Bacteroidota bacterium]
MAHQKYLLQCPDGYKSSAFLERLNCFMQVGKTSMKMVHKAGDKLFVDFTGKKLQLVDDKTGEVSEIEVFVAILGCSQLTFVMAVHSQRKEDVIADADFTVDIQGNVYAFDSTTIDLCLNVFWWATFRSAKGAVKLHTLYDIKTAIPSFIHITPGSVHDVNALDVLLYEAGSYYIMDRGYVDFSRLYFIHQWKAFFVTRAKDNFKFKRLYSAPTDKSKGIKCDQTIMLQGYYSLKSYPEKLRRIKFYDEQQQRTFVFITNNFTQSALDIALLYKYRWKVELFFKWIKQHLKIKSFWGTSVNAVKTQVYIAIITYTLASIIKSQLKINRLTYEILQILGVSLFDKTRLNQLLQSPISKDVKELNYKQLKINLI